MAEEQRHGWQMAYLLMTYFGQQGRREAQKLLERNAQDGDRLLGAFNRPMPHWLDFFCYTMFVDRDGKFQLGMLSTSAFKPLAAYGSNAKGGIISLRNRLQRSKKNH